MDALDGGRADAREIGRVLAAVEELGRLGESALAEDVRGRRGPSELDL